MEMIRDKAKANSTKRSKSYSVKVDRNAIWLKDRQGFVYRLAIPNASDALANATFTSLRWHDVAGEELPKRINRR